VQGLGSSGRVGESGRGTIVPVDSKYDETAASHSGAAGLHDETGTVDSLDLSSTVQAVVGHDIPPEQWNERWQ